MFVFAVCVYVCFFFTLVRKGRVCWGVTNVNVKVYEDDCVRRIMASRVMYA